MIRDSLPRLLQSEVLEDELLASDFGAAREEEEEEEQEEEEEEEQEEEEEEEQEEEEEEEESRFGIGTSLRSGEDFAAEETVHAVDEEEGLVVVEVAVFVQLLECDGLLLCGLVSIFADDKGFAAEAGQGIQEAQGVRRVVVETALLDVAENLGEADLNDGFLEADIAVGAKGPGMIAQLVEFVLPIQGCQILLVRAGAPFGNVIGVKLDAVPGHFFDDLLIGFVLIEELVQEHTVMTGELGDFAHRTTASARFEIRRDFDW